MRTLSKKIGRPSWAVKQGVLEIVTGAIVGSKLRYGPLVMRYCIQPDLTREKDAYFIGVAARKICGASCPIRTEVLRFLAELHNVRNKNAAHCAIPLVSDHRATGSVIKRKATAELRRIRASDHN